MIVSASRRTDIPAFYMDWFATRLEEGFVLVRNPMNAHQIRRVDLSPDATPLVFWTKNAAPLLAHLPRLQPYPYYVLFTITPYGPEIEPGVPDVKTRLETFQELSRRIGRHRVIWRCDPLFWGENITSGWLAARFESLAAALAGCTQRCVISFVDLYRCMRRRFRQAGLQAGSEEQRRELAARLVETAARYDISLQACCEEKLGGIVAAGCCIDAALLSQIAGREITPGRDRNQRPLCQCAPSVDIGVYDSCAHGCLYCYAMRAARAATRRPDVSNPLLLG